MPVGASQRAKSVAMVRSRVSTPASSRRSIARRSKSRTVWMLIWLRPHQGDERAPVLEHRDLSYFGGTAIAPLHILGAHFLTPAQHEGLLHSAADKEETVAIDKSQIAGPIPSVRGECLTIGLGIVEIAVGDRTPMQFDLADPLLVRLGNADLAGERPSDAARTTRPRPIAGEQ